MGARGELPQPKTVGVPSGAEIASDYIRTLVFTGVLRTDDKVPVEEIALKLGLSRQPVREALIELGHDGLIRIDGRRGTYVAAFGPSTIRDHYELYGVLQGYAVHRITEEQDPAVLAELKVLAAQARHRDDPSEVTRLTIEFARVLNRAAGNTRLRIVMRAMTRFTPGEYYLTHIPDGLKRARATMRAQIKAIEARDADAAEAIVREIWTRSGEEVIATLRRDGVFPSGPSAARTTTIRS